jgi:hypothetical protein
VRDGKSLFINITILLQCQSKKVEIGWIYSSNGENEKCVQRADVKTLLESSHLEEGEDAETKLKNEMDMVGPCHHGMGCHGVANEGDIPQIRKIVPNIFHKKSQTAEKR